MLDLIQEGNIGLMNAVRGFAERPVGDFADYASTCIDDAIKKALLARRNIAISLNDQQSKGVNALISTSKYEASSRLLLWQAKRNYLPIFLRPYPLRNLFSEAARYEEFNDRRHKSPHL